MQNRHTDRTTYFREQEYTTRKYIIPFIERYRLISPEMNVLEVGCGEGGNMKPFLDRGCRVTGVDLARNKIDQAGSFFKDHPHRDRLTLICEDIYNLTPGDGRFDLIVMRDVIEHIYDQEKFMEYVRQFMHPATLFFLGFPPWQNPFGGHQQLCRNRLLSVLPWFHLLPLPLYRLVLKAGNENEATISSLSEIKKTGLSIDRFEKIIRKLPFLTADREFHLINPNYEVKFNMKPVRQTALIYCIPWFRNFLTTSAYYLITPG